MGFLKSPKPNNQKTQNPNLTQYKFLKQTHFIILNPFPSPPAQTLIIEDADLRENPNREDNNPRG